MAEQAWGGGRQLISVANSRGKHGLHPAAHSNHRRRRRRHRRHTALPAHFLLAHHNSHDDSDGDSDHCVTSPSSASGTAVLRSIMALMTTTKTLTAVSTSQIASARSCDKLQVAEGDDQDDDDDEDNDHQAQLVRGKIPINPLCLLTLPLYSSKQARSNSTVKEP